MILLAEKKLACHIHSYGLQEDLLMLEKQQAPVDANNLRGINGRMILLAVQQLECHTYSCGWQEK